MAERAKRGRKPVENKKHLCLYSSNAEYQILYAYCTQTGSISERIRAVIFSAGKTTADFRVGYLYGVITNFLLSKGEVLSIPFNSLAYRKPEAVSSMFDVLAGRDFKDGAITSAMLELFTDDLQEVKRPNLRQFTAGFENGLIYESKD